MANFTTQSGTVVFGASSRAATVTLATAVDPTRAFPFLSSNHSAGSGRDTADLDFLNNDDLGVELTGWDGTEFTITRSTASELVDHRYEWQVWSDETNDQATNGWFVRSIFTETLNTNDNNVLSSAISSIVDWEKCIPIAVSCRGTGTTRAWGEHRFTIQMTSSKQVRVRRDSVSDVTRLQATIAVVEFGSAWTITNNRIKSVPGPGGTITDVTGLGTGSWANKFYFQTYRCGDGQDQISAISAVSYPKAGDDTRAQIRTDIAALAYTALPRVVMHSAYHAGMMVEHRNSDDDGLALLTNETADQALVTAIDLNNAGLIATMAGPGGTAYPGGHWTWKYMNTGSIRFRRGRALPNSVGFSYQAITFPTVDPADVDEGAGDSLNVSAAPGSTRSSRAPGSVKMSGAPGYTGVSSTPDDTRVSGSPGRR